jgi:glycosyltransferase involved in cell wall biosynthesis
LNICYVAPDVAVPHFRGASTHVYEVSRNLSLRGHRVCLVSRRLSRSQPRWERIDGFQTYRSFQGIAFEIPGSSYAPSHADSERRSPVHMLYSLYLGSYRAFQLGAELATIMSGRGIDIVIERETAFGAGAVLSSMLGVPMVLEMIGPRVSALSLKRANRVLAYSKEMVGGRVPSERLVIVPAGVNTSLFSPNLAAGERVRRRHGLGSDPVVGYVGTFQRWHGVNDLLSACQKLRTGGRRFKVLLVGPYFRDAATFAEDLGLSQDAVFVGPIPYDSVPDYVNACDVLCAPYDPSLSPMRRERGIGAPLKVLEYMSCEKPVVSTKVPPITDVVDNGRTGLLVPPGDVASLASAIAELIDSPSLRETLGRDARKSVLSGYAWDTLTNTLEDVLSSAMNAPQRRRRNWS